jgi:DNA-binding GntR family transcriptional regulator
LKLTALDKTRTRRQAKAAVAPRVRAVVRGDADQSRVEFIRESVERDIVAGRLVPGVKLNEESIAARHGASRTPVREALRQLASKGLVELRSNLGAFVAQPSVTELAEMFEVMSFLESACAALAAVRHTAEDRRLLAAAHERCAESASRNDPNAFYAANARFHECIYSASHNSYLQAQTIALRNRLEVYRRESTFHPGLIALTMREHKEILEVIFEMDATSAAAKMRSHLDTLRDDAVSMHKAVRRPAAR